MNPRMAEATRLTRSGRLKEAMALLRAPNSPEFNFEQVPVAGRRTIDMVPPLGAIDGAWTAPPVEEDSGGRAAESLEAGNPTRPDGLRDLMERLGQFSP